MIRIATIALVATALTGCITANNIKKYSLENSMKEWNKTLRAAHIIPTVPLVSENALGVGSVYVSPLTMNAEVNSWDEDGYLEINNIFSRITIDSKSIVEFKTAIPSYAINYNQKKGIGTRLNVNAIPLAAAYASANDGTISVTLKNVVGKGLSDWDLHTQVLNWEKENKPQLTAWYQDQIQGYGANTPPIIVRVISKIFTAQSINVIVKDDKSKALKGQFGAPGNSSNPTTILVINNPDIPHSTENVETTSNSEQGSAKNEQQSNLNLTAIKREPLETTQPTTSIHNLDFQKMINEYGGYFRVGGEGYSITHFGNSVSINEDFQSPLVVGYWALEYMLTPGGKLIRINRNLLSSLDNKNKQKYIDTIIKELSDSKIEEPL